MRRVKNFELGKLRRENIRQKMPNCSKNKSIKGNMRVCERVCCDCNTSRWFEELLKPQWTYTLWVCSAWVHIKNVSFSFPHDTKHIASMFMWIRYTFMWIEESAGLLSNDPKREKRSWQRTFVWRKLTEEYQCEAFKRYDHTHCKSSGVHPNIWRCDWICWGL